MEGPHTPEPNFFNTQRVDLRVPPEKRELLRSTIQIEASLLAADKWREMVAKTQKDLKERGVIVSTYGKDQKIIVSKIFEGMSENAHGPHKRSASFVPPQFPHGIKSLFPRTKDIALIHSHPMPPNLDHLQTTMFSDLDIRGFANSTYTALAMVDRGGIHVLLHQQYSIREHQLPEFNIADRAITEAQKGEGLATEAMMHIGKLVEPYGIRYYYSPNLTPDENGLITLQDVRTIQKKSA